MDLELAYGPESAGSDPWKFVIYSDPIPLVSDATCGTSSCLPPTPDLPPIGEIVSIDGFLGQLPRWKLESIAEPYEGRGRKKKRPINDMLEIVHQNRYGKAVGSRSMLASVLLGYLHQKSSGQPTALTDGDDGYEVMDDENQMKTATVTNSCNPITRDLEQLYTALQSFYRTFERVTPFPHCRRVYKLSELFVNLRFRIANNLSQEPPNNNDQKSWLSTIFDDGSIAVLTGPPGSGKSVFVRRLASEWPEPYQLVFTVRLRELVGSFYNDILEMAFCWLERKIGIPLEWSKVQTTIRHLLVVGQIKLLIVLDGLDEIDPSTLCPQLSEALHTAESVWLPYHLLLTSRPYILHCLAAHVYQEVQLQPFNQDQMTSYVTKHFQFQHDDDFKLNKMLQLLRDNQRLCQLAQNPLMLTCICAVFDDNDTVSISGGQTILFDCFCEWLLKRSGVLLELTKGQTSWKDVSFIRSLSQFALYFLTDGNSLLFSTRELQLFNIENICFKIGFLTQDLQNVCTGEVTSQFLFKPLQEYFAALCILSDLRVKPTNPWTGLLPIGGFQSAQEALSFGQLVHAAVNSASEWRLSDPLRYTGDTAMLRDLSKSLLDRSKFDKVHMVKQFAETYLCKKFRGYSYHVGKMLEHLHNNNFKTDPFQMAARQFKGNGSFGNGAAVRTAPVALLCNTLEETVQLAKDVAKITHSHPEAILAAVVQASAVHFALNAEKGSLESDFASLEFLAKVTTVAQIEAPAIYRGHPSEGDAPRFKQRLQLVREMLVEFHNAPTQPNVDRVTRQLGNGVRSIDSIPTALFSFLLSLSPKSAEQANGLLRAIEVAIGFGGNAHTRAMMAAAVGGAYYSDAAVPAFWGVNLEAFHDQLHTADRLYQAYSERSSRTSS